MPGGCSGSCATRPATPSTTPTGFRLRKRWRQVFGPASRPYPTRYAPRTTSRNYVMHLGHWYAQSHPSEDFAETFAVWLAPNSTWRADYEHWHALRKLRYVDELMTEIRDERPPVRRTTRVEPLDYEPQHPARALRGKAQLLGPHGDRALRRAPAPRLRAPGAESRAARGGHVPPAGAPRAHAPARAPVAAASLPGAPCDAHGDPAGEGARPLRQPAPPADQARGVWPAGTYPASTLCAVAGSATPYEETSCPRPDPREPRAAGLARRAVPAGNRRVADGVRRDVLPAAGRARGAGPGPLRQPGRPAHARSPSGSPT